jgi:hypothetical protein
MKRDKIPMADSAKTLFRRLFKCREARTKALPVPKSRRNMTLKSSIPQFTSSLNCIATAGIDISRIDAMATKANA